MLTLDISNLEHDEAVKRFEELFPDISTVECSIYFAAKYSQSKVIRDMVRLIFEKNEVHPDFGWKFALVTDELLNNAIEHGSQPGDTNMCVIHAKRDEEKQEFTIALDVHDTGRGEKTTPEAMRKLRINHYLSMGGVYMKHRGRGLFLMVEKLVDALTFDTSPLWGLNVHVDKRIHLYPESSTIIVDPSLEEIDKVFEENTPPNSKNS